MQRGSIALALLGVLALSGCGGVDPFVTIPHPAEKGQPAGVRVAICYDRLATTAPEVQAQAQKQCTAGTIAKRVSTDWYLQYCPLLTPARATFVCTTAKKK